MSSPPRYATAYCDGGGGPGSRPFSCAAVIFVHDDDLVGAHEFKIILGPGLSNNIAEYEGLILALKEARKLGVTHLKIRSDSKLIVEQALGHWRVKEPHLRPLHRLVQELAAGFESVKIDHVPRESNRHADALCREALRAA